MKRIAITMREYIEPKYAEKRDSISKEWIAYLNFLFPKAYFLLIPNNINLAIKLIIDNKVDALLLTNGNDWGSCYERDDVERLCFSWCRQNKIPILGVCRGLHMINVMMGGSITCNLNEKSPMHRAGQNHYIDILGDFYKNMAETSRMEVNSFHNHGVTYSNLGSGLKPFAMHGNDIVEAFAHEKEKIYAIQWHPERKGSNIRFDSMFIKYVFSELD